MGETLHMRNEDDYFSNEKLNVHLDNEIVESELCFFRLSFWGVEEEGNGRLHSPGSACATYLEAGKVAQCYENEA